MKASTIRRLFRRERRRALRRSGRSTWHHSLVDHTRALRGRNWSPSFQYRSDRVDIAFELWPDAAFDQWQRQSTQPFGLKCRLKDQVSAAIGWRHPTSEAEIHSECPPLHGPCRRPFEAHALGNQGPARNEFHLITGAHPHWSVGKFVDHAHLWVPLEFVHVVA